MDSVGFLARVYGLMGEIWSLDPDSLHEKVHHEYAKNVLVYLNSVLIDPEVSAKDLREAFTKHWQLVKGNMLCYTACPQSDVTLLLCDIAEAVATELGIEPIEVLMPGIKTEATLDGYPPDLTKIDLKTILRTHILSDDGKHLLPVNCVLEINSLQSKKAIGNPYYDPDVDDVAAGCINPRELHRMFEHNVDSRALRDVLTQLDGLMYGEHYLLGQLNLLLKYLTVASASGAGEEINAGESGYAAMARFDDFYKQLTADDKNKIPEKLKKQIEILLNLDSERLLLSRFKYYQRLALPQREKKYTAEEKQELEAGVTQYEKKLEAFDPKVARQETCLNTRRRVLASAMSGQEVLLGNIGLSQENLAEQLTAAKNNVEAAKKDLVKKLTVGKVEGQDSLGLSQQLLDQLEVPFALPNLETFKDLLKRVSTEELKSLLAKEENQREITAVIGSLEKLILLNTEIPLHLFVTFYQCLASELKETLLSDSGDVGMLLDMLSPEQQGLFINYLISKWVTSKEDFISILKKLSTPSQCQAFCEACKDQIISKEDFISVLKELDTLPQCQALVQSHPDTAIYLLKTALVSLNELGSKILAWRPLTAESTKPVLDLVIESTKNTELELNDLQWSSIDKSSHPEIKKLVTENIVLKVLSTDPDNTMLTWDFVKCILASPVLTIALDKSCLKNTTEHCPEIAILILQTLVNDDTCNYPSDNAKFILQKFSIEFDENDLLDIIKPHPAVEKFAAENPILAELFKDPDYLVTKAKSDLDFAKRMLAIPAFAAKFNRDHLRELAKIHPDLAKIIFTMPELANQFYDDAPNLLNICESHPDTAIFILTALFDSPDKPDPEKDALQKLVAEPDHKATISFLESLFDSSKKPDSEKSALQELAAKLDPSQVLQIAKSNPDAAILILTALFDSLNKLDSEKFALHRLVTELDQSQVLRIAKSHPTVAKFALETEALVNLFDNNSLRILRISQSCQPPITSDNTSRNATEPDLDNAKRILADPTLLVKLNKLELKNLTVAHSEIAMLTLRALADDKASDDSSDDAKFILQTLAAEFTNDDLLNIAKLHLEAGMFILKELIAKFNKFDLCCIAQSHPDLAIFILQALINSLDKPEEKKSVLEKLASEFNESDLSIIAKSHADVQSFVTENPILTALHKDPDSLLEEAKSDPGFAKRMLTIPVLAVKFNKDHLYNLAKIILTTDAFDQHALISIAGSHPYTAIFILKVYFESWNGPPNPEKITLRKSIVKLDDFQLLQIAKSHPDTVIYLLKALTFLLNQINSKIIALRQLEPEDSTKPRLYALEQLMNELDPLQLSSLTKSTHPEIKKYVAENLILVLFPADPILWITETWSNLDLAKFILATPILIWRLNEYAFKKIAKSHPEIAISMLQALIDDKASNDPSDDKKFILQTLVAKFNKDDLLEIANSHPDVAKFSLETEALVNLFDKRILRISKSSQSNEPPKSSPANTWASLFNVRHSISSGIGFITNRIKQARH